MLLCNERLAGKDSMGSVTNLTKKGEKQEVRYCASLLRLTLSAALKYLV